MADQKTRKKPDTEASNPLNAVLVIIIGLVILGAVASGGLSWYASNEFTKEGPLAAETTVTIPQGSGLLAISELLNAEGVIGEPFFFQLGVKLRKEDNKLRAGEFAFPPGVSMEGALDILLRGQAVLYPVTVSEGLTSYQVVDVLRASEVLTGTIEGIPPEGSLLPETYKVTRGDDRMAVIDRMTRAMEDSLAELWANRQADLPFETPREALILASIVEKETGVDNERAKVAGVFVNRMRIGMRLQSDPTTIYGITRGEGPLGRKLLRRDVQTPSDYNTYTINGLPPGPIANPGRASLEAVLNPAETTALYFVADGSGGHAFADTLQQHNRNVAAWRRFQREQGN